MTVIVRPSALALTALKALGYATSAVGELSSSRATPLIGVAFGLRGLLVARWRSDLDGCDLHLGELANRAVRERRVVGLGVLCRLELDDHLDGQHAVL